MTKPNGLDALQGMRSKATSARHAPPPRHAPPARSAPNKPAEDTSKLITAKQTASGEPTSDELLRCSIYLDGDADTYLDDIRGAGRRHQPKVDASRSAVVRYALEQLARKMSPADVADALSRRRAAAPKNGLGRKRL